METKTESTTQPESTIEFGFQFFDAVDPTEKIDIPKDDYEFSVLSYNILADDYIKPNYFQSTDRKYLQFKYRSNIIYQEVKALDPDILIFQEVDNLKKFYDGILKNLGYVYVNQQRKNKADSCLVAFRKDKFDLIKSDVIDFDDVSQYNFEYSEFYQDEYFKTANVAVVVRLRDKKTSKEINVIGTHFFWDPKKEDAKFLQAYLMEAYIAKNFKQDEVVIWGGDLNSKEVDNTIQYVRHRKEPLKERIPMYRSEMLEVEKRIFEKSSKMENRFDWRNLYEIYGPSSGNQDTEYPPYTNYTDNFKAVIDHLLYNKNSVYVRKILKLPSTKEIGTTGLPNQRYPSDHLPIMGVFGFKSDLVKLTSNL